MLASDFLSDKNFMITVIKIVIKMCIMFIKGNILIPYTEILMRKVYLRVFFMSETSEKKTMQINFQVRVERNFFT